MASRALTDETSVKTSLVRYEIHFTVDLWAERHTLWLTYQPKKLRRTRP